MIELFSGNFDLAGGSAVGQSVRQPVVIVTHPDCARKRESVIYQRFCRGGSRPSPTEFFENKLPDRLEFDMLLKQKDEGQGLRLFNSLHSRHTEPLHGQGSK